MIRLIREGYFDYFDRELDFIKKNRSALQQIFEKCGFYDTFRERVAEDWVYMEVKDEDMTGDTDKLETEMKRFCSKYGFRTNVRVEDATFSSSRNVNGRIIFNNDDTVVRIVRVSVNAE